MHYVPKKYLHIKSILKLINLEKKLNGARIREVDKDDLI